MLLIKMSLIMGDSVFLDCSVSDYVNHSKEELLTVFERVFLQLQVIENREETMHVVQTHLRPWITNPNSPWPTTDTEADVLGSRSDSLISSDELGHNPRPSHADYGEELDVGTISITHYTSLKDLMSISSLKRGSTNSLEVNDEEAPLVWFEVSNGSFKNKLLNEAARAYLLPMSPERSRKACFFRRGWIGVLCPGLSASLRTCLHDQFDAWVGFFRENRISRAFRSLARTMRSMMRLGTQVPRTHDER
jgi:hypothetical protein